MRQTRPGTYLSKECMSQNILNLLLDEIFVQKAESGTSSSKIIVILDSNFHPVKLQYIAAVTHCTQMIRTLAERLTTMSV
ncbi:unnamed protein product [Sphenostylis stenocarpa]|uniref:Uncharacterized protein n=1 Tax=Sphenostylis stenocarpa TaxID=92480 RepID=A0AA86T4Y6_9FABA|nr:unnamed protein product [Sphenostylis stenocarpa]